MNKQRREHLTAKVTEILNSKGILNENNQGVIHELVTEFGKVIYESLNRKVPYEVYLAIWKKYNLQGGYTVSQLATDYSLSITTVTQIVKNKYW